MNVYIYTANIGGYDSFKDSPFLKGFNTCYLADREMPGGSHWEQILVHSNGEDSKRTAGYYKTSSHLLPPHDISVWIDASLRLKQPLNSLLIEFIQSREEIMIPRHPRRACTYIEAEVCKKLKKDIPAPIDAQMERYRAEGFPQNAGMVGTTIIFRKNTPAVGLFNRCWHREIVKGSRRDQLSVMYTCWKTGIPVKQIDIDLYKNKYFKLHRHLRK